jgi:hypothetical protein
MKFKTRKCLLYRLHNKSGSWKWIYILQIRCHAAYSCLCITYLFILNGFSGKARNRKCRSFLLRGVICVPYYQSHLLKYIKDERNYYTNNDFYVSRPATWCERTMRKEEGWTDREKQEDIWTGIKRKWREVRTEEIKFGKKGNKQRKTGLKWVRCYYGQAPQVGFDGLHRGGSSAWKLSRRG